jgi:Rad52/22 family double-strand break repair protein
MSQHQELFAALAAPFESEEVRLRPQGARQLQYITARTVMNRLDDVLGPENWWDEYQPLEHSVICRLTIKLPDGATLTKSDAGGYAGMPDSGDDDKSGFSDAFKRAAVKFGIGRYLYRDGVPRFLQEHWKHASAASETRLPHPPAPVQPAAPTPAAARSTGDGLGAPQTGKALFAWTKQQDEKFDFGLLKTLSDWAKLRDFPAKMIHWSPEQVQLAYAEACAVLQGSPAPALDQPKTANGAANGREHSPNSDIREANSNERPATSVPQVASTRKDREPSQPRAARTR